MRILLSLVSLRNPPQKSLFYLSIYCFPFVDDVSTLNCCNKRLLQTDQSNIKNTDGRDHKKISSIGGPIMGENEAITYIRTVVIYFTWTWAWLSSTDMCPSVKVGYFQ